MYFPRDWEFDPTVSKHRHFGGGGYPPNPQPLGTPLTRNKLKEKFQLPNLFVMQGETSDIQCKSQIYTVLRYLSDSNICERFLEFTDISFDGTCGGLYKRVQQLTWEFECGQIFGHNYDGASVRKGLYKQTFFHHIAERVLREYHCRFGDQD
jgi:hypothetical protein